MINGPNLWGTVVKPTYEVPEQKKKFVSGRLVVTLNKQREVKEFVSNY